jgi:Mitochondrial carrier protein
MSTFVSAAFSVVLVDYSNVQFHQHFFGSASVSVYAYWSGSFEIAVQKTKKTTHTSSMNTDFQNNSTQQQSKRRKRRCDRPCGLTARTTTTMFLLFLSCWNIMIGTSSATRSAFSTIPRSSLSSSSSSGLVTRRRRRTLAGSTIKLLHNDEEYDHMAFVSGHRGEDYSRNDVFIPAIRTTRRSHVQHRPSVWLGERHAQTVHRNHPDDDRVVVHFCSMTKTLLRGAALRIASDLSGGTPLENIKTRTTLMSNESPLDATRNIVQADGLGGLWKGSPSRTVEGALVGAVFMLASRWTKTLLLKHMGTSPTVAALSGGLVGGVAQAAIMTPCGLIFTALNSQQQKQPPAPGHVDGNNSPSTTTMESTLDIVRRVVSERGIVGMYAGLRPMSLRQATNWASRAGLTEITRSMLGWSRYGMVGELASGVVGGVGSCWNTPIETIRVYTQRDVHQGKPPKEMGTYWNEIVANDGYAGLFRGYKPRAIQAIWQTTFLIVVPNILGI